MSPAPPMCKNKQNIFSAKDTYDAKIDSSGWACVLIFYFSDYYFWKSENFLKTHIAWLQKSWYRTARSRQRLFDHPND